MQLMARVGGVEGTHTVVEVEEGAIPMVVEPLLLLLLLVAEATVRMGTVAAAVEVEVGVVAVVEVDILMGVVSAMATTEKERKKCTERF